MSELKAQITTAMKEAMRAKDKDRLGTIRMVQSAIKQVEVDERIELDDQRVLAILDKLVKQRKDSATQYREAERPELAEQEEKEIEILQDFLPQPLTDEEIDSMIAAAIAEVDAEGMQAMGKVMGILKPQLQGRADMGAVSGKVKSKLVP